ncbi:unnamed protein product, partial [Mesorhabditis belari]|uniref:Nucleolar protein 6 n=1 Tax=Mesorhabditis belari TaxID=2138241 RepID=A0AAF3EET2_9BILA
MKRERSSSSAVEKEEKGSKSSRRETEPSPSSGDDKFYNEKKTFCKLFDFYYRVSVSTDCLDEKVHSTNGSKSGNRLKTFAKHLIDALTEGMGERFDDIGIYCKHFGDKQILASNFEFFIAFRASTDWSNPLTTGPIGNLPEAATFREFWGEKSELRKFGDNTIKEAVLWAKNGNDDVPNQILTFLLDTKFSILPSSIVSCCHVNSLYLPHKPTFDITTSAFARLNEYLRGLKDIPLRVTTVIGTSPFLRGTEPLESSVRFTVDSSKIDDSLSIALPNEKEGPFWTRSIDVFIRLEYSYNWGNDVELIRQFIIAFYVLLSEQLKKQCGLHCHPTTGALYVQVDKTAFRIVIVNEKILAILGQKVENMKNSGMERVDKSTENIRLAHFTKIYKTELGIKQRLGALSLKYRHFAAACQLFKHWLGRQMLSEYLHNLAIELLVAAVFETNSIPRSAAAAFYKVLLLLTTHDWLKKPLIVDLDEKSTDESRAKIEADFVATRFVLPPMVIATQEDPIGTMWTTETPTPTLMRRLIAVASLSCQSIEDCFTSETTGDLNHLFQQQELQFDAKIMIHPSFHVDRHRVKIKGLQTEFNLPVLDFHPVELFVERLQNDFQKVALFFYDRYSAGEIGLKWNDPVMKMKAKIYKASLYKLDSDEQGEMVVNKGEIYEEIGLMGKAMVSTILEKDLVVWSDDCMSELPSDTKRSLMTTLKTNVLNESTSKNSSKRKRNLIEKQEQENVPVETSSKNIPGMNGKMLEETPKKVVNGSQMKTALQEFLRDPTAPKFNSPKQMLIIDSTSGSEAEEEQEDDEEEIEESKALTNVRSNKHRKKNPSKNGQSKKMKVLTPSYRKQTVASKLKRKSASRAAKAEPVADPIASKKSTKKGKNGQKKRQKMDDLTEAMTSGMQVDPNALGTHPRYSMFKNTAKAAEAQANRRADALDRQRNARIDHHNKMRQLAQGPWEEEDDEETTEATEDLELDDATKESSESTSRTQPRQKRNPYENQLMTSEWLVDIPDKEMMQHEWIMVPCPVGRRCLIVASQGVTTAYAKNGKLISQFASALPGGRGSQKTQAYTILDCILGSDRNVYCLDLLCWKGAAYTDNDFAFRQFFLRSRIEELSSPRNNEKKFILLPSCLCEVSAMETFMQQNFPFTLDGLLFYYSEVHYIAGQNPLVGWLKPFMLPDVLNVKVPSTYLFSANGKSTNEFIKEFNDKNCFKSKIEVDVESIEE